MTQKGISGGAKTALIYDSACPICSTTVKWIEKNGEKDSFEMVACQSETLDARFPGIEPEACRQAMHLVLPDGTVLRGEKALPEIFKRLKRYRPLAAFFRLPGVELVGRIFYRWFAVRRYAIAGLFHISLRKNK